MRVVNPSTPAQYFHVLRKQTLDPQKKPLIVMTPKSLLRQKFAGSTPEQLAEGGFQSVLADDGVATGQESLVKQVILCSGKIYYDLQQERGDAPVALLRVEQLYPWPTEALAKTLARYPNYEQLVWCQEEPRNMGGYAHVTMHHNVDLYAGRAAAASPATGFLKAHKVEQLALVRRALAGVAE
jgi:2-oxoglutarate dehydrogenase E1 component